MLGNTHTKQLTNQDEKHLRFLIDVCITPNTAFSNQIDFPELLSLAKRHRLVGSLNKAVSAQKADLPTSFITNLSEVASKIAFKNLQLCHQLVLLAQKFKQEELQWMSLKGPVLAQEIFGELSFRQSSDLDILVRESDLEKTDRILREAGFNDVSETPFSQLNPSEKKAFAHISHELPYYNPKTNSKVELHWKLVAPKSLFPKTESEIWGNKQLIPFGGIEIPTLSQENQLLYLCVHGAKHQWFRLFWLRDVWQIINRKDFDLDALLINLEINGNHRSLLSGLVLCSHFFGYMLSQKMEKMAERDSTFQEVLKRSQHAITSPEAASAPSYEENIWGITKNLMQLKKGWRYKLECLHRFRTSPQDWEKLKLPKKWFFLYYFARPFIILQRRIHAI